MYIMGLRSDIVIEMWYPCPLLIDGSYFNNAKIYLSPSFTFRRISLELISEAWITDIKEVLLCDIDIHIYLYYYKASKIKSHSLKKYPMY